MQYPSENGLGGTIGHRPKRDATSASRPRWIYDNEVSVVEEAEATTGIGGGKILFVDPL